MLKVNAENLVRYKGKWRRKKLVENRLNLIKTNKTKSNQEPEEKPSTILRGIRLVDPNEYEKNMKCSGCEQKLSFGDIIKEKTMGFHCVWTVECKNCTKITLVNSGKSHTSNDGRRYFDINTASVLGAVHSGAGCTALQKIAMCINMPNMSDEAYKRYEREIGPLIEQTAKESCARAADEERRLVFENIDKLRDKM